MSQIYYTYILQYNNTRYYGHTNDLKRRVNDHVKGRVRYTREKNPKLVYYEHFNSRSQAFKREMQFKNGKTRKKCIDNLIKNFAEEKCQGFNSTKPLTNMNYKDLNVKGKSH